jgi:hypothetical protein
MTEQREQLAQRFFAAAHQGDLGALEALLAQNVVLHGDGGGKVPALARSTRGRSRVARTLLAWARRGLRVSGAVVASGPGERSAGRPSPRRHWEIDRREGARHSGRTGPSRERDRQPR